MCLSMSDRDKQLPEQESAERDELLRRLLKTPPQQRPKRERDSQAKRGGPKPDPAPSKSEDR